MEQVIQKIHNEFDTAVDAIVKSLDEYKKESERKKEEVKNVDNETKEKAEVLKKAGFINTHPVRELQKIEKENISVYEASKQSEEFAKKLRKTTEFYQNFFPFHKFILYPQVIDILEKYDLYLGHTNLYKENVPEKNVEEIKDFFANYEVKIIRDGEFAVGGWRRSIIPFIKKGEPLCSAEPSHNTKDIQCYICAPRKEFVNDKGVISVERELFYNKLFSNSGLKRFREEQRAKRQKIKDPIVLMPVSTFFEDIVGFIIITKWGLEAEDPQLTKGINN